MRGLFMARIAFVVIFFTLPVYILSQNFNGGLTAGLVGSQVGGDGYSGYNKAGVFAGAWVNIDVSKHSAFQMEITYIQKGSRHNPDYDNDDYDSYIFRTNYMEIPLLYQYKIKKFIFEAGPSTGISVGHYEEFNGEVLSDNPDYDMPATFTLQANLGIRFVISKSFSATMRINYSTFNIRQDKNYDDGWTGGPVGQFNNALILAVYYRINKIKGKNK
jgi:hypothetical protein